jgi:hypothetical protein
MDVVIGSAKREYHDLTVQSGDPRPTGKIVVFPDPRYEGLS